MLVDTHAHLADAAFDSDRAESLARARQAGVSLFIEIAESPQTWDAALALSEQHADMYVSLGIHPHHAHETGEAVWPDLEKRLRTLLKHPKVVAIGEFGLDYYRMQNTKAQQQFILLRQLELAREFQKPIVIHCREDKTITPDHACHADLQHVLGSFYPERTFAHAVEKPNGVIHCFSGTWDDAQFYMAHGFLLGIDGPVTYPNAKPLQDNVKRLPLERMVLETDSPYLPPQTHRGQRNEPLHIPAIAAAVATLKHTTPAVLAEQTSRNARALFRLN